MDSFTERMVERAQKRKQRMKMQTNNLVDDPITDARALPLKDSVIINRDKNLSALVSDKFDNESKIMPKGKPPQEDVENTPVDRVSTTNVSENLPFDANLKQQFFAKTGGLPVDKQSFNSPKVFPDAGIKSKISSYSTEDFSLRTGTVLERASVYEATRNPKKVNLEDPCELSIADRKALFEKNKGPALLPKVPFSQPLPTRKIKEDIPPLELPPKLMARQAPNKHSGYSMQLSGTTAPISSHLPPPPPPKPDHLRAFLEKVESSRGTQNDDSTSVISEHRGQDTSYESIASSESSLGQKIVRLAQKRSKEIENRKKQNGLNLLSASECELDLCGQTSDENLFDLHASGPTPPKQYRSESSETLSDTCSDHNSNEGIRPKHVVGVSNGSNGDLPFTQSVSFYRKAKNQPEKSGLVKKVVHQSVNSVGLNRSKSDEKLEREAVNKKIAELQQKISAGTTAISQATQALNLCSSTVEFNDSAEQIEAERLLLLATHRRQAAMNEVQRLKVEGTVRPNKPNPGTLSDQGSLTVSEITLPVKFDAIQIAAREEKCHNFVCLLKCDEIVLGTSLMTATNSGGLQQTSKGIINMQFPNVLTFPKLYSDFKVTIEIYDLLTRSKEALPHDVKYHISNKKDLNKFRITPKKQKACSKLTATVAPPPSGSSTIRASKFSMVGYIVFSLREVRRTQFTLNKVIYSNPLDGKMTLKLSCELSPSVERRGFLTMFEDVSGFGAWHRRWCLLKGDSLSYWKYPDDERTKLPIDTIDLNTCTTQTVTAVSRDICARPNTLLLETIRPARDEDVDSLVVVRHAAHTMVRYLLSTDTKEERIEWCATLNKALDIIRAWRRK